MIFEFTYITVINEYRNNKYGLINDCDCDMGFNMASEA